MDTSETSSRNEQSKLTTKVSKLLVEVINTHVKEHTNYLLNEIAKDFNISKDILFEKYGELPACIDMGKGKKKVDGKVTEPKKRGRKKKIKEELVETEEYEYNGVQYLVDKDNNVYTYNVEQPVLVGTKLIDGRIKFIS